MVMPNRHKQAFIPIYQQGGQRRRDHLAQFSVTCPLARIATENAVRCGNGATPSQLRMITTDGSATASIFLALSQQPQPQAEFEPILNVPAFSVFVLVAILFVSLQWRVAAIGRAAEERTRALDRLRLVKTRQLTTGDFSQRRKNDDGDDDDDHDDDVVQRAMKAYEGAYWKVERLRTVIPGMARLVPPPSQSWNRQIMKENEAAAQQFLGIIPEREDQGPGNEEERKQRSPFLVAVLVVVALSQMALLVLFVASDPMMTTGLGVDGYTSPTLLDEVVDTLSGFE